VLKLFAWMGANKILTVLVVVMALGVLGNIGDDGVAASSDSGTAAEAARGADGARGIPEDPAQVDSAPSREADAVDSAPRTRSALLPAPASSERERDRTEPRRFHDVVGVVDGDTVKVAYRGLVSVRVIGIDTPETVSPSVPDECWGARASAAAHRLLDGREVALVFDRSQGRTDHFGRTLAYLDVKGAGDYGLAMIRRGHAAEYTYDTSYRYRSRYQSAESRARAADAAMWGACGGPDTPLNRPRPVPAAAGGPAASACEPGYDPCVPPYPPDVDCADVDRPVHVTGSDPHGLDGEGDGIACE